jgi:putative membrane protein
MRKTIVGFASVALAVTLLGQQGTVRGGGIAPRITNDQEFVAHALAQGILEVKLSERAAKQATDARVREFAQKLVNEHEKCNKKLLTMASEMKLAVVAGLDKDSKETFERVTRLEGDAFNRAYIAQQVKMHERAIDLFEKRASATKDATVKGFINDALPNLRQHLKEAREISAKVGGGR